MRKGFRQKEQHNQKGIEKDCVVSVGSDGQEAAGNGVEKKA